MNNIHKLELSLLAPDIRKSPEKLNELIADDFVEFGCSGKVYNKLEVISALADEEPKEFNIEDFTTSSLSDEVVLATYKVTTSSISSLRSSIWKINDGKWQMVFHQGTICKEKNHDKN